jgi:hypothetical protein
VIAYRRKTRGTSNAEANDTNKQSLEHLEKNAISDVNWRLRS